MWLFIQHLPKINVTNAKKVDGECFAPESSHSQNSAHYLLCKVVCQPTNQKKSALWSLDSIKENFAFHWYFDISTETYFSIYFCIIPVRLNQKCKKKSS